MRILLYLIRKEFLQIFRDRFLSRAIFAIPIVQMLILVPAVTFEIKEVKVSVLDSDMSPESRDLVSQLEGTGFFRVRGYSFSMQEAHGLMEQGQADLVLHIPRGFGKELGGGATTRVLASVNAINATNARLCWAYLNGVIQDINAERSNGLIEAAGGTPRPGLRVTSRTWYNELLNYTYYMLPGVLGILVLSIGFILAGLNLVKEKESGTIEQINVTPVKKYQFILSKMIPFLLIGLTDLALGLSLGKLVFGIPFEGQVGLLFIASTIFLVGVLGLALLISTFSSTQQQFMFTGFFFMIIFILMSGVFTPVESMPGWAQQMDRLNPMVYIMRINRMVLLKGSTFVDIRGELLALSLLALAFTSLAVNRYRKTA